RAQPACATPPGRHPLPRPAGHTCMRARLRLLLLLAAPATARADDRRAPVTTVTTAAPATPATPAATAAPAATATPAATANDRPAATPAIDRPTAATAIDRPGGAAAARVQRFAAEAAASDRARSGALAPAWRDVERALRTQFQPVAADVTSRSSAQLLLAQYRAGLGRDPRDPANLGISAYDQPAEWQRTEVEVLVDEHGQLRDARVLVPSGRAHLDQLALDAARAAVAAHPPRPEPHVAGKRQRVRFAVESGVSVMPIDAAPLPMPGGTQPNGAVVNFTKMHFDEARATVTKPDYIGHATVHTRITLSGIEDD
ncbi:MAG TPA: TonB family protein, partial [Polyangia bacterium]|nr:TonB family protein [Polyangia bacterium]